MRTGKRNQRNNRKGAVVPLFAIMLVPILAMVAFAIDLNYIATVKTELQRSADAAALAGAGSLLDDEALKGQPSDVDEQADARTRTATYSAMNPAGKVSLQVLASDITVAYVPNPISPDSFSNISWVNAVRVKLRRDSQVNQPLGLFFAKAVGINNQAVYAEATAIYEGAIKGFKSPNGVTSSLLPYTLKASEWDSAFTSGQDNFKFNETTGAVEAGSDGIKEVKLFPDTQNGNGKGNGGTTPGNFGTVDIGSSNNSTADIARQIVSGPNAADFSHLPGGKLELGSNGTLSLNGDTGISAGVKDELADIKGKPRTIPLYTSVSGNGNNSQYTISRFAGIRVMDVKLTGSASSKYIMVQPAYVIDATAIRGGTEGTTSQFVRQPLRLIK